MSKLAITIFAITVVSLATGPAEAAGVGTLVRKGVSTLTGRAKSTVSSGAASGARHAGHHVAKKAVSASATGGASQVTRQTISAGARASGGLTASASTTVLNNLGIAGARSMSKLSTTGSRRLADISSALAKSPHRQGWLAAIGKHGDRCVNYLWQHKGMLAAGTAAGAVLLASDDFINAMERVSTATVKAAGQHVMEPLITSVLSQVTGFLLYYVMPVAAVVGGVWWYRR